MASENRYYVLGAAHEKLQVVPTCSAGEVTAAHEWDWFTKMARSAAT